MSFIAFKTTFGVLLINPLSPHDALKHHFTPLKTDLIFLQLGFFFFFNFHETGLLRNTLSFF